MFACSGNRLCCHCLRLEPEEPPDLTHAVLVTRTDAGWIRIQGYAGSAENSFNGIEFSTYESTIVFQIRALFFQALSLNQFLITPKTIRATI